MRELIEYREIVAGLRHFDCTRLRATISTTTCAARYASARVGDNERLALCRRCPIGAMHATPPAADGVVASDVVAVASALPLNVDSTRRCVRCGVVAQRVIGKVLCPSCYNRSREARIDSNAKGTAPTGFKPLSSHVVGMLLPNGQPGYIAVPNCQNSAEPLARLQRQRPGVQFHNQRPGGTHWNARRRAFEYRDQAGRVVLQIALDGLLEHVAVSRLRPGETPAPVRSATSCLTAKVAATWLNLTELDSLTPEWRPTAHVCAACSCSALMARHRGGVVSVQCRFCGDSA